jgi:hypothetical protein
MPIYGYLESVVDPDHGLLELREVSFSFSPSDLRRIADFLRDCADRMEAEEWKTDHAHIDSFDPRWKRQHPVTDVVVLRPTPDV